jgi:peptide subunit release factor 1 (eRF1)
VAGFDDTLTALEASRVDALVVLNGVQAAGIRCTSCSHLASAGEKCAQCGSAVVEVPDLVEVAIEEALGKRCRVETVEASKELESIGGIGALLRF